MCRGREGGERGECVWERERVRKRERESVCRGERVGGRGVCVGERESKKERGGRERERENCNSHIFTTAFFSKCNHSDKTQKHDGHTSASPCHYPFAPFKLQAWDFPSNTLLSGFRFLSESSRDGIQLKFRCDFFFFFPHHVAVD